MKEKGLGRSKKRNSGLTLMLLRYYKVIATTKQSPTTYIQLTINRIIRRGSVVSEIHKK